MAILKVAQLGNPILRRRSSEVPLDVVQTPDFQRFIDDMVDTMRDYDGVGIAAPQVHTSLRVLAMEVSSNPRYPNKQDYPLTVMINPLIMAPDSECIDDWEGCLSVPGMRGFVPRTHAIRVTGMNRHGETINLSLEGFPRGLCSMKLTIWMAWSIWIECATCLHWRSKENMKGFTFKHKERRETFTDP